MIFNPVLLTILFITVVNGQTKYPRNRTDGRKKK